MNEVATAPLVSVLMPAYNHEAYVRAAVESVLGQTYRELELIVIDDASQDGTWEVLESFEDARLSLKRHKVNQGAHATLNEALEMAEGEYIAILNSDDVYHSERLEVMVSHLQAWPNLGAAFSHYAFVDAAGHAVRDSTSLAADFPDPRAALGDMGWAMDEREIRVLSLLARNYLHSTSNLVCRRTVFDEIGGFSNYRYVHDHDFFLRLCHVHRVEVMERCLLDYRFHDSNTLAESATASVMETGTMLMNFLLSHEIRGLHDSSAPEFQGVFAYLLESLKAYGAEKFMLLLALAESNGRYEALDVREKYPALFNCQRIGTLVGETVTAAQQEDELAWQREQTTQWWEAADRLGARAVELEAHNAEIEMSLYKEHEAHKRVGHELWLAKQEIEQHKQEIEQHRQEIEQHKQEIEQHKQEIEQHRQEIEQHRQETEQVRLQLQNSEREYSNLLAHYRGTWCFRVRQWAKRLRDMMVRN